MKKLVSLSEEQLLDCSFRFGNNGCNGGWPSRALQYIKASGGLQAEDSHPYGNLVGRCKFNGQKVAATCRGSKCVGNGSERALQKAVASVGPISVAVDAGRDTFQLYKSGVYDDAFCSQHLNHTVLLGGYGRGGSKDYRLVKNRLEKARTSQKGS